MKGFKNIDVTAGSNNKLGGKLVKEDLSPLLIGPVTDKDGRKCLIFENFWQARCYTKAGHVKDGQVTKEWEKFCDKQFKMEKGKRRPFAKALGYGAPDFAIYNGKKYDYITSRKEIYVPIYAELVKNTDAIKEMKKMLESGENIMILDGDGPPKSLYPEGLEMTQKVWDGMIKNPQFPFGHGYVVAGLLAGIEMK